MKRQLRRIGTSLAGIALVSVAVPQVHAGNECLKIRSRAVFDNPLGQPDCSFEGETFDFCLEGKVRGTLRGTWDAYGKSDWFVLLPADEFPVPEKTVSNYNREFNVVSTRHGDLIGDSQYVFDLRIFDVGGGFVAPIIIERGTGRFEGATGWISATFTNGELSRAKLLGEVCGPYVRGDGDRSDDRDEEDDD